MENRVKKGDGEGQQKSGDAEPHENERVLILLRWRRSDAEDEGQPAKQIGQKIDHRFTLILLLLGSSEGPAARP